MVGSPGTFVKARCNTSSSAAWSKSWTEAWSQMNSVKQQARLGPTNMARWCFDSLILLHVIRHIYIHILIWSKFSLWAADECPPSNLVSCNHQNCMWRAVKVHVSWKKKTYKSVCVITESTIYMLAASCCKHPPKLQTQHQHDFYLLPLARAHYHRQQQQHQQHHHHLRYRQSTSSSGTSSKQQQ